MAKFDLSTLVRPKIYSLEPYRCARDDFKEGILLDANENTHGPALSKASSLYQAFKDSELNRYPDPHQIDFKTLVAHFRNSEAQTPGALVNLTKDDKPLSAANMCLGVGSDESIDALIRTVCRPGIDSLIICPPTYGMYKISSQINDVEIVSVPLCLEDFEIDLPKIQETLASRGDSIKMILITTPGNPTGRLVSPAKLEKLLQWSLENWNGLVVADEAYIDFSDIGSSVSVLVNKYPNLVTFQTLSKSFGLAGIRLGITFASEELAGVLNALKAPYNISTLTSTIAQEALTPQSIAQMRSTVDIIKAQRSKLIQEFKEIDNFGKVIGGGLDSNFILVETLNNNGKPDSAFAKKVYENMAINKKTVVRYRGNELGCVGALRISIGTAEENKTLVENFKKTFAEFK
ncbi:histidinol-phosphate transaminase [Saccharomycopsis crataegensis]|uniref:histidinol-phosphate transaminase n=1 Tax=Saccharomycopsis crataegensis TaxID=43959 RepID=A0AAV5QMN8_9ASCO|nr:histidinol-phosphate transaminase [Saccharomycopsis crataegensis]